MNSRLKWAWMVITATSILLNAEFIYELRHRPEAISGTVEVHFSPHGGARDAIMKEIDGAKGEILVQAYSFTSPEITRSLIAAHLRKVKVTAVIDKGQYDSEHGGADDLQRAGIDVRFDTMHAIAHNKVIIVDQRVLVGGSYNYTENAEEHNAENALIIRDDGPLTKQYTDNFWKHYGHSIAYTDMAAKKGRKKSAVR